MFDLDFKSSDKQAQTSAAEPLFRIEDYWTVPDFINSSASQAETIPVGSPDAALEPKSTEASKESESKVRFESDEIEEAVSYSKKNKLPLLVQIGLSTCQHCQHMENNIWPQLETKNELAQKAVVLHLDYAQSAKFTGNKLALAETMKEGVEAFPTLKIYKPGLDGILASHVGSSSVDELKEFMRSANIEI